MITLDPALHAAAHIVTLRVIQSLVEGSLIGLFAAGVLRFWRCNAGTRFAVWFSSLLAIAAVPALAGEWLTRVSSVSNSRALLTLPDSWAVYLLVAWAAFAAWFLFGLARSLWHLRTLRKSCIEVDPAALEASVQHTLQSQRGNRTVVLCTSEMVKVPTAIGLINPAVVIPGWVMQELSADELNQILLHEFAHLRRWDDWTNLAQQLVKAVFFFHPLVWWIEKNAALEREMACDDAVVAETGSPHRYAECLTHLAEKSFVQRSVALAQAALGKLRQTTLRVTRILDPERPSHGNVLKPAVTLVGVFAMACGVWTARTSTLVAFEDGRAQGQATPGVSQVALMRTAPARVIPATLRSPQVGVIPAKLNLDQRHPTPLKNLQASHRSNARPEPHHTPLVHLTSSHAAAVPVAETVFVVIEDSPQAGVERYQVQLWRVMVLRTVANPAITQTSHKEI